MKTLYVTDLDGTLLNRQNIISQKSIDIINGLIERGIMFTYATARSFNTAPIVTKGLLLKMPVIVYNGALILEPSTKEVLASVKFTEEEAEDIVTALLEQDIIPMVYAYVNGEEKVSWLATRENEGIDWYLRFRKNDSRLRPVKEAGQLFEGEKFYFACIGEEEELLPIYHVFSKDKRFRCTIQQELYRTEYWCEIMPAKATKAEAIKKLKEIYKCDRIVSFGDAINDVPMFEISDECYAVDNAVPELKAVASGEIGSNEEDGVATWLKENVD